MTQTIKVSSSTEDATISEVQPQVSGEVTLLTLPATAIGEGGREKGRKGEREGGMREGGMREGERRGGRYGTRRERDKRPGDR